MSRQADGKAACLGSPSKAWRNVSDPQKEEEVVMVAQHGTFSSVLGNGQSSIAKASESNYCPLWMKACGQMSPFLG